MTRTLLAVLLLGGACSAAPSDAEPDVQEGRASCGAEDFQEVVGQDLSDVSMVTDLKARILRPTTITTMDYLATRMNIAVDADGVITRIYCG